MKCYLYGAVVHRYSFQVLTASLLCYVILFNMGSHKHCTKISYISERKVFRILKQRQFVGSRFVVGRRALQSGRVSTKQMVVLTFITVEVKFSE